MQPCGKGPQAPGAGRPQLGRSEHVPRHREGKPHPGGSSMGRHRTPSWGYYTQQSQMFLRGDTPSIGLFPGIQGQDTRERLQASSGGAQAGQEGAFPYREGHTCPRLPGEEVGAPGLSVFEAFGQCCDMGQP